MIYNFNKFINESTEEKLSVYTFNKNDVLEFQELLHKNDYYWPSKQKYIINEDDNYSNVLFFGIDKKSKFFIGYIIHDIHGDYFKELTKEHIVLEYPKDKPKILDMIEDRPTYKSKVFLK